MDVSELLKKEYKNILFACDRFRTYGVSLEQTLLEFERIGTRLHQLAYCVNHQDEFDLLEFVQHHLFNGLAMRQYDMCGQSGFFCEYDF